MFLTANEFGVEEFLQSLNFIAPQGTNIKYFVTPLAAQLGTIPEEAGFTPENRVIPNENIVRGVTDTVSYMRKNPQDTHSYSPNHIGAYDTPQAMPKQQGYNYLTDDMMIGGGEVMSPEKLERLTTIVESGPDFVDIQLTEDWSCFPAFSIFHCERV